MAVRLSVSCDGGPPFIPQEDSWYSFLSEAESAKGTQCGWKDKVNFLLGLNFDAEDGGDIFFRNVS
jgi:hypothetical protein